MSGYIFVLAILFLTIVAPIAIIFHYITQWKQMKINDLGDGRVAVEEKRLWDLYETAENLEDRVKTLEKLLDAEAPGWRDK